MSLPIYLDYNATTPVDERVLEAMLPYLRGKFGNAASSTHRYGWVAEEAVKQARASVAETLNCLDQEIVFTSGATEGNNLALKGVAEMYASKGNHIITVATEHKAILDVCERLERQGKRITYLGVDKEGHIDLEELSAALSAETILVSVMLANNETGVIHPMEEIADLTHQHGAILMSDATQAVGKIPVDVQALGIDLLTLSAHKFYGPKGVGAIYIRRRNPRVRLMAQMDGGGHERGFRSGTLNVPGIVGMGKALEICREEMGAEEVRLGGVRDRLEKALLSLPETERNGSTDQRLAHVSNLTFRYVNTDALVKALRHVAVATGSACTSASMEPSHVLTSMGRNDGDAHASIRFSLGRFTTEEEMDRAIEEVIQAITQLREISPAWQMRK